MTRLFVRSIHARSQAAPHAVALETGAGAATYQDLALLTDDLSVTLACNGVGHRDVVHIPARKTAACVAAIAATQRLGAVALLTAADLGAKLEAQLLVQAGASARVNWSADQAPQIQVLQAPAFASRLSPVPEQTALLLCTSGSTGDPKLVPIPEEAVERFLRWAVEEFDLDEDTSTASIAPLNFDISLLDVWATLHAGGTAHLVGDEQVNSPKELARRLAPVDLVQAVPTVYRTLSRQGVVLPSVRQVISTGEPMTAELARDLATVFPDARRYNVYGATETNDSFLYQLPEVGFVDDTETVWLGSPIAGVEADLMDGSGRLIQGAGTGELVVHTPFQACGYVTEDGLDSRQWISRPDGAKWYRTGDLAQRNHQGRYRLLDRADRVVKVRGVRTSLAAVEAALLSHPDVAEAVVLAVPDDVAGLVLHAVVGSAASVDALALRQHCAAALPRTALPSRYHLLTSSLPRNANGKFDRNALGSIIEETEKAA